MYYAPYPARSFRHRTNWIVHQMRILFQVSKWLTDIIITLAEQLLLTWITSSSVQQKKKRRENQRKTDVALSSNKFKLSSCSPKTSKNSRQMSLEYSKYTLTRKPTIWWARSLCDGQRLTNYIRWHKAEIPRGVSPNNWLGQPKRHTTRIRPTFLVVFLR